MEISSERSKIMAFCKDSAPSKISVNNRLSYLSKNKMLKFDKAIHVINKTIKPSLVLRHIRTRSCKTLVRSVLFYGNEVLSLQKKKNK